MLKKFMANGIILASSLSGLVVAQTQTPARAYQAENVYHYGNVCTRSKPLNQRIGASQGHGVISRIPKGNKVGILASSSNNNWLYVNHQGKLGWVHKSYICD